MVVVAVVVVGVVVVVVTVVVVAVVLVVTGQALALTVSTKPASSPKVASNIKSLLGAEAVKASSAIEMAFLVFLVPFTPRAYTVTPSSRICLATAAGPYPSSASLSVSTIRTAGTPSRRRGSICKHNVA